MVVIQGVLDKVKSCNGGSLIYHIWYVLYVYIHITQVTITHTRYSKSTVRLSDTHSGQFGCLSGLPLRGSVNFEELKQPSM